ncbi:MAG: hypothetical protein WC517_02105 [Patescibacteria group bacterium]
MSIVARIFGKKIKGLGQALTDQIILLDPKTASEAQIDELDANFQQLSLQLAEAEQSLTREQQEADAIETNYNRKVTAARILGNKAETATDLAEKDKFNASLEALLNEIEKMQSDVEREKAEAVDARNLRDQLNETTRAMAENLKSVRSALKSAERSRRKPRPRPPRKAPKSPRNSPESRKPAAGSTRSLRRSTRKRQSMKPRPQPRRPESTCSSRHRAATPISKLPCVKPAANRPKPTSNRAWPR